VRLSIGIEDVGDLIDDLAEAFNMATDHYSRTPATSVFK
jgi:hypothetical protein